MRPAVALLVLFVTLAPSAAAQSMLSARIVDHESGRPLACFRVTLLDSAGVARDSTVSLAGGVFYFTVPDESMFRLRVADEAFEPALTGSERVGRNEERSVEFRIALTPNLARLTDLATTNTSGWSPEPTQLDPRTRGPRYPNQLQREGTTGIVYYSFALDTLGRIDTASALPLGASHPAFQREVRRAIPELRYLPWSSTRPMTCMRIIQAFVFALNR